MTMREACSRRWHSLLAVIPLLLVASWATAAEWSWRAGDLFVPGQVLVKFKPNTTASAISALHAAAGANTIRTLPLIEVHHLTTRLPVEAALSVYNNSSDVAYAEPNYIVHPAAAPAHFPDDPFFPHLWGLHNAGQTGGARDVDIDAPKAWGIQAGSRTVVVAVIDTGRFDHADLLPNLWINPGEVPGNGIDDDGNGFIDDVHGWNFFGNNNVLFGSDQCNEAHGTHVSGILGAVGDNDRGVVGVAWQVSIMSLKFLGGPGCSGSTADAIRAIQYAAANGAHLSSNSWGGGGFSLALKEAIEAGLMLFVASAGNGALDTDQFPHYPSGYDSPNILSVAATTHTDAKSSFSNFGASTVDLGAPGSAILSTVPFDDYGFASGTSMATPHVAGAVALLYSQFPSLSPEEAKCRILAGVDAIPALAGITVTGGRLNVFKALTTTACDAGEKMAIAGKVAIGGVPAVDRRVILTHQDTGAKARTTSDATGTYQFEPMTPGRYRIDVREVTVTDTTTVSGHLRVGDDPSVGTKVKLRNQGTGVTVRTTTDRHGDFSFTGVVTGPYRLIIPGETIP